MIHAPDRTSGWIALTASFLLAACGNASETAEPSAGSGSEQPESQASDSSAHAATQDAARRARAVADERGLDGVIVATMDGQERVWAIESGDGLTGWEPMGDRGANVTLLGYATPDEPWDRSMEVGFEIADIGGADEPSNSLITFYSRSATRNHSTGRRAVSRVAIANAAMDQDQLTVSGAFAGTLNYVDWGGSGGDRLAPIEIGDGAFYAIVNRD